MATKRTKKQESKPIVAEKAFMKTLRGLPRDTKKDLSRQFKDLLKKVETEQKKVNAQSYLSDFSDDILQAELNRRKNSQTAEIKAEAKKIKAKKKN